LYRRSLEKRREGRCIRVVGGLMTGLAAVSNGNDAASGAASGMCCLVLVLFPAASLLVCVFNRVYLVATRGASIGQSV
jgi:hypothetical protein